MTYYVEPMRQEDVPEVSEVDRLCFTNPWPQSAYRRELRKPDSNFYIVLRDKRDDEAAPHRPNGHERRPRRGFLTLPWRNNEPERRDPIIGFAGMWLMFDEAHITTIGVHPDYRGQSLGELLMVHLIVEAVSRGAEMVTLEVRVSNEPAQSLYRKYGFTTEGIRRRYYSDNGEDAYIMWSPRVRDPEFIEHFDELRAELAERLAGKLTPAPEYSDSSD